MRIEIQGVRFALTAPLLDHTARRLRFALTRTGDRIKRVVVRLGVGKGPGAGENKFCRIQVVLEHAPPVLIEDAGADLYAAIDRAAERAGRGVASSVDRQRESLRLARLRPDPLAPDESTGALRH
ncbi:MAG: HPF/RaiA family ribosome-associated protein [Burkholderiales bacterium]|nr:HPF/RaiA family ribosome-associated protein [Burkholderiales bacterium]